MARQMKDSGIEWIGEIPKSWEIRKLKNVADIIRGGSPRPIDAYLTDSDEGCNWIKIGDTQKGYKYIDRTKQKIIADGVAKSRIVHKGDLLLTNSMSFGEPYILNVDGCIHDGWVSFTNYKDISIDFLYYFLSSPLCFIQFQKQVDGGVVQNLNIDKVGSTIVFIPPIEEQHRIADFLDRRCAEIDAVIERTKATIEEYKKLKQAVITEAVTKGVRGPRPMKDSGIEWLGSIPDAWDCTRLKQVWISVDSGVSVNAADYPTENDDQYGVLKTSCVSKFVFLPNEHKQVDEEEYARVACPVKKETIIVSRMNTPDLVGACGYVDADYPNLFLPDRLWQISFFPEVSAKFVWYYLNNQKVRAYISSLSTGTSSSMQNISKPQFGGIALAVPTIEEQDEIVRFLDEKCAALDTLIAKKAALLTELETYKKSLIYEYVTGKKEV